MSNDQFLDDPEGSDSNVELENFFASIDENLMEDLIAAYLGGDREALDEILEQLPADIPKSLLNKGLAQVMASQEDFGDDF